LKAEAALETSTVRVLVVEDYEPFRRFVCSTLGKRPELQVIGEASDGLQAVQKAEEMQSDLIVLDIGLPTLNGIEAARRIRKLSPESKILFVSQESSADVVQEALSSGALGYVVKTHAGSELLAAVEAVRQGRQYISSGLSGHRFTDTTDPQASRFRTQAGSPIAGTEKKEIARNHEVQFYSDDASFLAGLILFIEAALGDGNTVIVVATESHRKSLLQRLQEHGVDIVAAVEKGRYVSLDVADTLSTFMVNDLPDPVRFLRVAGNLVASAAKASKGQPPRVAACGECAPTLWEQGKSDAAVEVEHLWDEIAKSCNVDILCGYVLNSFQREQESHIYERICAEHSAVSSQ
jgi:DNA-binding NarL/FixJ family response regulator